MRSKSTSKPKLIRKKIVQKHDKSGLIASSTLVKKLPQTEIKFEHS